MLLKHGPSTPPSCNALSGIELQRRGLQLYFKMLKLQNEKGEESENLKEAKSPLLERQECLPKPLLWFQRQKRLETCYFYTIPSIHKPFCDETVKANIHGPHSY